MHNPRLVNIGATYTVVSRSVWKRIGIKPLRKVELTLGNGRTVKGDVGIAEFEIRKRRAIGPILLGEPKDDNV